MKHAGKIFLIVASSLALQGCGPKNVKAKPAPTSQAPTATTDQTGAMYPPPFPEKTVEAPPALPAPTQAQASPPPKPDPQKKTSTKKKPSTTANKAKPSAAKPATTPATGATADTTVKPSPTGTVAQGSPAPVQQAESVEPAAVSPIGQLSSGNTGSGTQKRRETSDLITSTEQGLNGIKRTLTDQEQETATQIRTLLKQAKQALTVDDVDGASTLATKAKVLLEELTKP